jgi:hypothetical protein
MNAWKAHREGRCSCGRLGRLFVWIGVLLRGESDEGPGCIAYTPEALAIIKKLKGN